IGQAAYAASKAGIVGLTLPAARDLARTGIRVLGIGPGPIARPVMRNLPPDIQKALGESVPFPQRLGHAHEVSRLVLHMIENAMLNGEVVRLAGGLRAGPEVNRKRPPPSTSPTRRRWPRWAARRNSTCSASIAASISRARARSTWSPTST